MLPNMYKHRDLSTQERDKFIELFDYHVKHNHIYNTIVKNHTYLIAWFLFWIFLSGISMYTQKS